MLESVRTALRVKSHAFDNELQDMIEACLHELHLAGAARTLRGDALTRQAVILYCKAYFGPGDEKAAQMYERLKITMANSSDYGGDSDGGDE